MGDVRLYLRYAAISLRSQTAYPGAFILGSFAQLAGLSSEFLGLWLLFARFGRLGSWSFGEVAIFYGSISTSFALAHISMRGFDVFGPEFVKTGNFDRLLLRPRSTILQLLGHEFRLARLGRLLQAVLAFAIGAHQVHLSLDARTLALGLSSILGGVALFFGIFVLQATLAFWTVESLEVANILTFGGVEAAQYPLDIYPAAFRPVLLYVLPIACVAYYPVVGMLGRHDSLGAPDWFLSISAFSGFVFLAFALQVWRLGVRRYTSTGS